MCERIQLQHFSNERTRQVRVVKARTRFQLLALTAWALCAISGCGLAVGTAVSPDDSETSVLTVNVARAALSENVSESASSFGTIKPRRSSSLGFARAGRVSKVFFEVGDFVAEGDKIAELDQGELVNQQGDLDFVLKALNDELDLYNSNSDVQRAQRKEEEIAGLKTQQEQLTREFQKGFIVAPYRGVIAQRNAEVGDAVPAGRPYFRILEAAQPIVELSVPVELASKVETGTPVKVKRGKEMLDAKVVIKAPELDASSRTQSLTLSIGNSDEKRKWNYGEVVEVQFLVATDRDGYWLPYSALQRAGSGLWSAFVIERDGEQQTARRRIVELIQLEDTHALVRGAINEGDEFITDGLNRVVPGQVVQGNVVPNVYAQSRAAGSRAAGAGE